jgi:hypothetical protein
MAAEDAAAVTCSLPAAEVRDRTAAWQAIIRSALQHKAALPRGVRLTFRPDHQTEHRLVDLTAAERDCCPWAAWNLTASSDATVVEVTADGHGAQTLQTMFEVTP